MKKIIYAMSAVALMASCSSGEYEDWAAPQSTPQEDAKTVALALSPASAIEFAAVTTDSVQLFVPTVTAANGAVSTYSVVMYNEAKDANTTITAAANGMVAKSELESAYYTLVGRNPVARTVDLDVTAYTVINGMSIKNAGNTTATLTADAPVIYSGYYLVGSMQGWDSADTSLQLTNGGGDVYADPTFTGLIPATGADIEFKVLNLSNVGDWNTALSATAGNDEGKFSYANEGGNLVIPNDPSALYYRVSFNLMEGTWSYTSLSFADRIYEIGNDSGWGTVQTLYGPNGDGKYTGYCFLNGNFKFKPNADNWDGDWGQNPNGSYGSLVVDGEQDCWYNDGAGYYKVDVDLVAMSYNLTALSMGVIGDALTAGWDADEDMTFDVENKCYTITTNFSAGTFKFRANDGWDINWGGTPGNLTQGADNIAITAGTHTVKLYINNDGTATCTID